MRTALLVLLLLPFTLFAQKLEFTGMVGYSAANVYYTNRGASYEAILGYYPIKSLSIAALLGVDLWTAHVKSFDEQVAEHCRSFGLQAAYHYQWFYTGAEVKRQDIDPINEHWDEIAYDPSWSIGVLAGAKIKIVKHVFFDAQTGLSWFSLHSTKTTFANASASGHILPETKERLTEPGNVFYLRAGLTFRI